MPPDMGTSMYEGIHSVEQYTVVSKGFLAEIGYFSLQIYHQRGHPNRRVNPCYSKRALRLKKALLLN